MVVTFRSTNITTNENSGSVDVPIDSVGNDKGGSISFYTVDGTAFNNVDFVFTPQSHPGAPPHSEIMFNIPVGINDVHDTSGISKYLDLYANFSNGDVHDYRITINENDAPTRDPASARVPASENEHNFLSDVFSNDFRDSIHPFQDLANFIRGNVNEFENAASDTANRLGLNNPSLLSNAELALGLSAAVVGTIAGATTLGGAALIAGGALIAVNGALSSQDLSHIGNDIRTIFSESHHR